MKTYNICQLLASDESNFQYVLPVTLEDGTTENLFTDEEFKNIIMNQYTSFGLFSPSYYDSDQKKVVYIIEDTDDAIEKLHKLFTIWVKDRSSGISKMLDALRKKYNPIWNVDGVEGTIHQSTHTGTDTDKKTGTEKIVTEDNGDITNSGKTTTENTGKSSNTKTGNETNTPTGSDVVTKAVTTYDDDTFRNTEKTTTDFEDQRTDTHTYNSVKDSYEVDSQDPLKETYEIDTYNPLKEHHDLDGKHDTTFDTTLQKTLNLKDEDLDMKIRQGNIGVTSTQSLIRQQIDLTDLDDIITYAIHDFVHRNLIILS